MMRYFGTVIKDRGIDDLQVVRAIAMSLFSLIYVYNRVLGIKLQNHLIKLAASFFRIQVEFSVADQDIYVDFNDLIFVFATGFTVIKKNYKGEIDKIEPSFLYGSGTISTFSF